MIDELQYLPILPTTQCYVDIIDAWILEIHVYHQWLFVVDLMGVKMFEESS